MIEDELTEAQSIALDLTARFVDKLCRNGVSRENALYEGYKFCEAALRAEKATCTRMDEAATIVGRAALFAGIHPRQVRAEMERKG